jgi:transposase-like protein
MSIGKDKKEIVDVQIPTSYVRASYALKRKIVDLISNGRISKNAAANKYNVSRSSIDYWMKKFSTLENKMVSMNQSDEIKKLKKLVEELELIKDFQQDLIAEFEIETGDLKSKKYLPEQLAKEIEKKRKKSQQG